MNMANNQKISTEIKNAIRLIEHSISLLNELENSLNDPERFFKVVDDIEVLKLELKRLGTLTVH